MAFNGVILVSVALDLVGDLRLPRQRPSVPVLPADVRRRRRVPQAAAERARRTSTRFSTEVRACALRRIRVGADGGRLRSRRSARRRSRRSCTSTPVSPRTTCEKANLRVPEGQYTQELLRQKGVTVGRLDARFVGPDARRALEGGRVRPAGGRDHRAPTPPRSSRTTTTSSSSAREDVQTSPTTRSRGTGTSSTRWRASEFPLPMVNTIPDLAHAMTVNPNLRVLVQNGTLRPRDADLRDRGADERAAARRSRSGTTSR